MKTMKALVLSALCGLSFNAFSFKECTGLDVKFVFSDGANTYISHNGPSSLDGTIKNTRSDYKTMVSIALAARVTGEKVKIRFVDDNVVCGETEWNTEISGIGF